MTGDTMRTLAEYIVELNRREREIKNYSKLYESAVTDTNGVEQDWDEKEEKN